MLSENALQEVLNCSVNFLFKFSANTAGMSKHSALQFHDITRIVQILSGIRHATIPGFFTSSW